MKARLPRFLVLTALLLFLVAFAPPSWALKLNKSEKTLRNGLRVIVIEDHRAPVVTHMVWYRVGAADEPAGKTGLAHFFEHLMFKGTDKIPPGAFSQIIERHGGNDNAFTSWDYTAYFQRIAREHLPLVMRMEADRMRNLKLTQKVLDTEREVIKEERRMRTDNDPRTLFAERMVATLYLAHPYRRPIAGWMDDVSRLTLEDALRFYRRHYSPNNAIVVVAGDVKPKEVFALAEKYYGPLKNDGPRRPRVRTHEPPPLAARRLIMADSRIKAPIVERLYVAPSYRTASKGEAHALEVLARALGEGTTSLLYRKLVIEEKIATWAGAWYDGNFRDYGTFGVYASPTPGTSLEKLERRIDAILAEVRKRGLDPKEVERAKRNIVAETTYALDSQFGLARMVGSTLAWGGSLKLVENWEDDIMAVTLEKVRAVAKAYLDLPNSVTGFLKKGLPQPRRAKEARASKTGAQKAAAATQPAAAGR